MRVCVAVLRAAAFLICEGADVRRTREVVKERWARARGATRRAAAMAERWTNMAEAIGWSGEGYGGVERRHGQRRAAWAWAGRESGLGGFVRLTSDHARALGLLSQHGASDRRHSWTPQLDATAKPTLGCNET